MMGENTPVTRLWQEAAGLRAGIDAGAGGLSGS